MSKGLVDIIMVTWTRPNPKFLVPLGSQTNLMNNHHLQKTYFLKCQIVPTIAEILEEPNQVPGVTPLTHQFGGSIVISPSVVCTFSITYMKILAWVNFNLVNLKLDMILTLDSSIYMKKTSRSMSITQLKLKYSEVVLKILCKKWWVQHLLFWQVVLRLQHWL